MGSYLAQELGGVESQPVNLPRRRLSQMVRPVWGAQGWLVWQFFRQETLKSVVF